jgi:hypothetical protein
VAIDISSALTGGDLMASFSVVLLIIYFLWFYAWGKKQLGEKLGLLLAIGLMYLTFYTYPELIWFPVLLFLLSTFGKEILERIPKMR